MGFKSTIDILRVRRATSNVIGIFLISYSNPESKTFKIKKCSSSTEHTKAKWKI